MQHVSVDDVSMQSHLLERARTLLQQQEGKEKIMSHSKEDLHTSLSRPFDVTLPCIDGHASSFRERLKSSLLSRNRHRQHTITHQHFQIKCVSKMNLDYFMFF